jgi:hypothetical protein
MVKNDVLNSAVANPADAIGVTTYDPGGGDPIATIYQDLYQVGGDFPDSERDLSNLLNRSYSDDPDHTYGLMENGPFEAVDFATEGSPLYYTNFIANFWLNVKTWKVTANIGSATVTATIPAGTQVTNSITNPTRPNSGKRGAYLFSCSISSISGDDGVGVNINPGIPLTETFSSYFQGPTPYLSMPNINIRMTGGTSEDNYIIKVADTGTTGSVSEDSNVTMLGQPMQTLTNSPTGYSLSIEAYEWWTTEQWITESDWASQT